MNAQPTWQRVPAGYYVDPITLRDAQVAQSAATKGGVVAPFRVGRHREPVAECHNLPESPIRERAYTEDQLKEMK